MAAADCAKSQDSSTDTMPVEMQGLKEVLEKASKKPLMKEDTWWVNLVIQVWIPPNVLLLEQKHDWCNFDKSPKILRLFQCG